MARLAKRSSRVPVGLDLDSGYIAAASVNGDVIEAAASVDLPPGLIREGEVEDVQGLSAALKDFFSANDFGKYVYVGVANQQIAVRSLDMPQIEDEAERRAAVRFQAAEAVAMPLEEAILDYQVVGDSTTPEGTSLMRVVVVAAREPMIMRIVDAVRGAGLRPSGVDLNAFAMLRVLGPEREPGPNEPARVFCHIAGITNLAVAVGRTCVFTRPLATTWDGGSDEFVSAVAEEVRLSMDYYQGQAHARTVGDIVIAGPGSQRPGIAQQISALVGLPVSVAPPLGRFGAAALRMGDDPSRYTVATGLALTGASLL